MGMCRTKVKTMGRKTKRNHGHITRPWRVTVPCAFVAALSFFDMIPLLGPWQAVVACSALAAC